MTETLSAIERPQNGRSLYTDLATEIRDSGLLGRRYVYYWTRTAVTVFAFAGLWAGFFLLGDSWLQLLLAGATGVVMTQFGFLGHDAAHQQMFRSASWNTGASRAMETKDREIPPGYVAFTPDAIAQRRTALTRWLGRHQGWVFFPLLTLEGLNLHVSSVQPAFAKDTARPQRIEAGRLLFERDGVGA